MYVLSQLSLLGSKSYKFWSVLLFDEFPTDDYKWFSPGSRSMGQLVHCFRLVETLQGLELKKYCYNEVKFHYTVTRITLATGFDDPWTPGRPWSNQSSLHWRS